MTRTRTIDPPPPRPYGRRQRRRVRGLHGRHGLCGGAALRLVLPHHRLRRHHAGRDRGAGRRCWTARSRSASTPTRRRAAVAVRAGAHLDRGEARRGRHRELSRRQSRGARDPRHRRLQRHAAEHGNLLPEDQLLLLHRADAQGRREARHGGRVLHRPDLAQDADGKDVNTITLSYTFYPQRDAQRPVADNVPADRPGRI